MAMEKNGKDQLDGSVTNKECAEMKKNKDKQICLLKKTAWQLQKHCWMGHFLRRDGLLHKIVKGRMNDKPTRERRRLQMKVMAASVKRAADERKDGDKQWNDARTCTHSIRLKK